MGAISIGKAGDNSPRTHAGARVYDTIFENNYGFYGGSVFMGTLGSLSEIGEGYISEFDRCVFKKQTICIRNFRIIIYSIKTK